MLKQLQIKNFTLIDTLDMAFMPGFSVITGETGAGKSIILGAISLLLGQRADSKTVKTGTDRCIIEAHFDLSRYQLKDFFDTQDIDYDETDCILRRELTAAGKSRSFINDTPVTLTQMRQLGQQLVDIHSQHQNLLLQEEDFQLNVIDIIAKDEPELSEYRRLYERYNDAKQAVERMQESVQHARDNEDFLRFQLQELADAGLEPGMQEELEQENEMLSHVEDIKRALFTTENIFANDGTGIIEQIKEASRCIENIKDVYTDVGDLADRLNSSYIELKDIAQEISGHAQSIDYDPHRLELIGEKLNLIYSLQRKHHVDSVEELISLRDDIARQLSHIDNSDEELRQLQEEEARLHEECGQKAQHLTSLREKAARQIEQEMKERLIVLGIPNVRFSIRIDTKPLASDGGDRICFLFSANKSTQLQPISEVASGGEIARVMLSLKAMISGAVKLPTIIFDEIDTGVSGKMAEKMAMIMHEMGAADRQVISITHLPQIAAAGTTHYKVYKEETPQGTRSSMVLLSPEERIQEIAQMLSGSNVTPAAISNARELLKL